MVEVVVVGNVAVDETYQVSDWPTRGASLIGDPLGEDVGGKGANVAILLGRAGIAVRLVAGIGNDVRGAWLRERLSAEPVRTDLMVTDRVPTDVSLVLTEAGGDNAIVTTVAAARSLQTEHALAAISRLGPGDVLVMHGNLPEALTRRTLDSAVEAGLRVVLNPSPLRGWARDVLPMLAVVIVNAHEANELTGQEDEAAARALVETGCGCAVVTLGRAGALLARPRNAHKRRRDVSDVDVDVDVDVEVDEITIDRVDAVETEVVDTTGAGDTFLAVALASALVRGTDIDRDAMQAATEAAAVTVGRHGTLNAFPSPDWLSRRLQV